MTVKKERTTADDGLAQLAAVLAGACPVCKWHQDCRCWGCMTATPREAGYVYCDTCETFATSNHWPPKGHEVRMMDDGSFKRLKR